MNSSSFSGKSTPHSTHSAPLAVNEPASCLPESQEVAAILASQCDKLLSCQPLRQIEKHISDAPPWGFGAMAPQATGSVNNDTASAEEKYEEPKPCSVPVTSAPLISTPSAPLDSKSGSSVLPSSQPTEEEQTYFPSVDLLHSTIELWERVVANKKTDQEVMEEGLRHFYEGINYFCFQSERLQAATAKYNEVTKKNDDLEKMTTPLKDKLAEACRKLEDSEKETGRLQRELAKAANRIAALTGEKESLLRVQMVLDQKIFELTRELEEAGPAVQKYEASSPYRQDAAPYMGKGVKLAIEKIKAKEPNFDAKTYGLEVYMLPPEADDEEILTEEGGSGADQEHNEVKQNAHQPTVHGISAEEVKQFFYP